jgi:hypothetical protein
MKKIIFILTALIQGVTYGQEKLIKLTAEPLNLDLKNFYISEVQDGRTEKTSIGFAQVGLFNKTVPANLEGGVENAIASYLNESLKADKTGTPIILRITQLEISEKTNPASEFGRAEIKVEFYRTFNDRPEKIFETGFVTEDSKIDVTNSHEKRIRQALTACLTSFNNSDWQSVMPEANDTEITVVDDETPIYMPPTVVPEEDFRKTIKWDNMLTINMNFGQNANGWGVSYYRFLRNPHSGWIFPWGFSVDGFKIKDDYFSRSGYQEAKLTYWTPGICALKRLYGNLYLNLTFQVPIGIEALTDYYGVESTNFFIGVTPAQGIYFVPKSRVGLTFGIGMYERYLTSEVYKSDLGFKAEIGIKF